MKNYDLPFLSVSVLGVTVLAMAAGFAGGVMASRFSIDRPALASESANAATAEVAKEISAKEFRLVDDHGTTHAALGFIDNGPGLQFFDSQHRPRVVFEMSGNGDPRLFLMDAEGSIRTVLGLGLGADGRPFIRMRDRNGKVLWSAPQPDSKK
jgi:hypothetical protein